MEDFVTCKIYVANLRKYVTGRSCSGQTMKEGFPMIRTHFYFYTFYIIIVVTFFTTWQSSQLPSPHLGITPIFTFSSVCKEMSAGKMFYYRFAYVEEILLVFLTNFFSYHLHPPQQLENCPVDIQSAPVSLRFKLSQHMQAASYCAKCQ